MSGNQAVFVVMVPLSRMRGETAVPLAGTKFDRSDPFLSGWGRLPCLLSLLLSQLQHCKEPHGLGGTYAKAQK